MQYIAEWLPWVVLAGGMVLTWIWTTYFWLRAARLPAPIAAIAAPAATGGVIAGLSTAYDHLGWFWSGARVLPVLALIGLTGAGLFWLLRRPEPLVQLRLRLWSWPMVVSVLVGWILAALPTMIVAPPDNPIQQWDPSFHMNGVWGITQLGVASPAYGLAHNYGGAASNGYPAGWHAFTSLFATGPTTVQTANASSLAIMFIWVLGAAVYAYVLFPSRTLGAAAAVIAGTLPSMPADALTAYSQWPNALSVAFLPGGAAVAIVIGRCLLTYLRIPSSSTRANGDPTGRPSASSLLWVALAFAVITLGALQAHQVYAFNLLFLLLPALVIGWWRILKTSADQSRFGLLAGDIAAAALGVAVFVWVELRPELQSMRNYPRNGVDFLTGLSQALIPNPPFEVTTGLVAFNVVFSLLLVAGLFAVWRWRREGTEVGGQTAKPLLWPVWSYGIFVVLIFFAYGPNWAIRRWVVGPWFSDGRRVMEAASLAVVPLLALGFVWVYSWLLERWGQQLPQATRRGLGAALGAVFLVASGFGGMDSRMAAARSVLDPTDLGRSGMASQEVLDLMRELPDLLPEDAVVLGDPQAGAMYAEMIGQRWAYFPQLSLLNADRETQEIIVERFGDLNWDPEVCEAIRTAGITYFFSAPDGEYYGKPRSSRMPGLYNVDTSVGFELVAEAGESKLYRITACETE